jgi:hypothetical protein
MRALDIALVWFYSKLTGVLRSRGMFPIDDAVAVRDKLIACAKALLDQTTTTNVQANVSAAAQAFAAAMTYHRGSIASASLRPSIPISSISAPAVGAQGLSRETTT